MKLLVATIPRRDWDAVRAALDALNVGQIGLTEVKLLQGGGRQGGPYGGAQYIVEHLPQLRLEFSVGDAMVARVIDAIDLATRARARGSYVVNALLEQHAIGDAPWMHGPCNGEEWCE